MADAEIRMNVQLRTATVDDAQAISDIYNHYVVHSTCTFDLERETLADRIAWMTNRGPRHPVIVCTNGGFVVGWGSLSAYHKRPAYGSTAEISFYVHHEWLRRGLGRKLLADLIDRARQLQHHVLIGGVCTEHAASMRLQESFGFKQVALLSEIGRKFDRWLDVAYMQLTLDENGARSSAGSESGELN